MEEKEAPTAESKKKQAAAAAVAAVASAGVVMGGLFTSPEDLLRPDEPEGVVQTAAVPGQSQEDEGDEDAGDAEDENRRRGSLRSRARGWLQRLPYGVKALVGVPLWAVGWAILGLCTALWSGVLSPVLSSVLGWILTAAVLLGAFALTGKALFPDLPLKKILNRRSLGWILALSAVLALSDGVLPLVWDGYPRFASLLRGVGTAAILSAVTAAFVRRERRRRAEKIAAPESPEPETMEQALRRARELADSAGVKP